MDFYNIASEAKCHLGAGLIMRHSVYGFKYVLEILGFTNNVISFHGNNRFEFVFPLHSGSRRHIFVSHFILFLN